jgi:hypothetical protein
MYQTKEIALTERQHSWLFCDLHKMEHLKMLSNLVAEIGDFTRYVPWHINDPTVKNRCL